MVMGIVAKGSNADEVRMLVSVDVCLFPCMFRRHFRPICTVFGKF